MKFETKYMIRWGIPGWVFIFWLFYTYIILKDINIFDVKPLDLTKALSLLVTLTAIGVPLGYIFQQISFGIMWIFNKKANYNEYAEKIGENFPKHPEWGNHPHEDYYQLEYVWHMILLNQNEETRKYLEERYRHLLGTIQGLGSLMVSSTISFTISIYCINEVDFTNLYFYLGAFIQLIMFISASANYIYFSNNLKAFQIKIIKTYL